MPDALNKRIIHGHVKARAAFPGSPHVIHDVVGRWAVSTGIHPPEIDEAQAAATALGSKRNITCDVHSAGRANALQARAQCADKRLKNLAAELALRGHVLQVQVREGRMLHIVSRWGQSRVFSHLNDLDAFLAQIGGAQ